MKRKVLIIALVLSLAALVVTGTLAFYTREDTAVNVITTGEVDIEITETTADGDAYPEEPIEVLPGDTVSKIVAVKNTSSHPVYVRVLLSKAVDIEAVKDHFAQNGVLTTDFNGTEWTVGEDGYLYYNKVLEAGQTTEPVMTKAYISGPLTGNEYRCATFSLNVDAFAVQAQNNGESALTAAGWSENSLDTSFTAIKPVMPE